MRPFSPRAMMFHGVRVHRDWLLKYYSISHDGTPVVWDDFARGLARALEELPAPDPGAGRPGLGFVIAHHGNGADYAVLCWWDRENELPIRVTVREQKPGAAWRPAGPSESVCVWDLEVIGFERDAWVETMLAPDGPDPSAWLSRALAPAAVPPAR